MGGCPHTDIDPNELTLSGVSLVCFLLVLTQRAVYLHKVQPKPQFCLISGPQAFSVRGMI